MCVFMYVIYVRTLSDTSNKSKLHNFSFNVYKSSQFLSVYRNARKQAFVCFSRVDGSTDANEKYLPTVFCCT